MSMASADIRPRGRRADALLFAVTVAELIALLAWTPELGLADWIYVVQHLVVLGIAFARAAPRWADHRAGTGVAVAVAYAYPYAQVIWLRKSGGTAVWPEVGWILVAAGAVLSFTALAKLGLSFGVRPALRKLATSGPYHVVRHPMYVAYLIADLGYNLQEWNAGTLALVAAGWTALIVRIRAEERVLAHDDGWTAYAAAVRWRLVPWLW
jgi:protein-S-isoprenylcysteine O-methyltransferase Ste14